MLKAADEKRRKKQENAGERRCGKKEGRDTNRRREGRCGKTGGRERLKVAIRRVK